MKSLLLASFFALGAAAERLPVLSPGRYELAIEGLLCRTCAQAVAEELLKLKEVAKVQPDFDRETVVITVRAAQRLSPSKLSRALSRAASRVDLGTKFKLKSVKYLV